MKATKFSNSRKMNALLFLPLIFGFVSLTAGHAYMKFPPGRSSLWRKFGPDSVEGAIPNYDDHGIICPRLPRSQCGVCGDNLSDPSPRDNEFNGKYGKTGYREVLQEGDIITVSIRVTVEHGGWHQWDLCLDPLHETEECFQTHILELYRPDKPYEPRENRWPQPPRGKGKGVHEIMLILPPGIVCQHCVMRWIMNGGNDWGCDSPNDCGLGQGPNQEKFYGCADVTIVPRKRGREPVDVTKRAFNESHGAFNDTMFPVSKDYYDESKRFNVTRATTDAGLA